jgi:hypothetical protein
MRRVDETINTETLESAKFDPQGRSGLPIPIESVPDPETKGKAPQGDEA